MEGQKRNRSKNWRKKLIKITPSFIKLILHVWEKWRDVQRWESEYYDLEGKGGDERDIDGSNLLSFPQIFWSY